MLLNAFEILCQGQIGVMITRASFGLFGQLWSNSEGGVFYFATEVNYSLMHHFWPIFLPCSTLPFPHWCFLGSPSKWNVSPQILDSRSTSWGIQFKNPCIPYFIFILYIYFNNTINIHRHTTWILLAW